MAEKDENAAAEPLQAPPDPSPVNASWTATAAPGRGLGALLTRLLVRFLGPQLEAQRVFNADQVRLDNALLRYVEERFAATHRHYDRILGRTGQRLDEVDERHGQLAQELVAHVHDLVKRIDLVLAVAERGHLSLEAAVEEVRSALRELEKRGPPR